MDCAGQRSSEPTCGGALPSPAASATTWAAAFLLQEATGDSECDDLAGVVAFDADDGDAESCSGGDEDDCCVERIDERRIVSWECWMMESAGVVVVGGEAARPASTEAESAATVAGDEDSDRLFWETCIAHGY
ncbi:hypothetical protein HU200_057637 [Digitaria exilis]|uniref:Uncharacterized protein n=1 Tax=Digitaria exilis TaxID=1010633 RepID=A0A835ADQ1_9POAL|nr:hypothetical protein HU200_057637 [Digitaria exilis]CAB3477204.1 unnamed protein product [Digitaria exilis]